MRALLLLLVCLVSFFRALGQEIPTEGAPDAVLLEAGVGEFSGEEDSLSNPEGPSLETHPSIAYDSLRHPGYIARQMRYSVRYDFLDYGRNYVEWQDRGVVAGIFSAFGQAGSRRAKVVHIGDSHVQADMYPGTVRNYLQRVFGVGGRGALFPYRAAGTHSAYDYHSYSSGLWVYDRNIRPENGLPLGMHGATVRTTDPSASLRFIFNNWAARELGNILKIYCRRDSLSFNLRLETELGSPIWVRLDQPVADSLLYVSIPLPPGTRDFTLRVEAQDSLKRYFECYGLLLETASDTGLTYYSMGINGATFSAVLNQNLMAAQLAELKPDLVLLDISGNEFYGRPLKPEEYAQKLRTWIHIVRKAAPSSSILVSCSQDILYRRRYPIAATETASQIARQVALSEGCAFYNWFQVSGGKGAIAQWAVHHLVKRDNVHLTYEGYRLKGELLANALLTSYYQYLSGSVSLVDSSQLAVTETALRGATPAPARSLSPAETGATPPRSSSVPEGHQKIVYTVRQGDVLGAIAERHHVYVRQIQAWNGLYSHLIYPGQKLIIYVKPGTAPAPATLLPKTTPSASANPQKPSVQKSRLTYTVKSGDTLWGIAQKYGTTVAALKQLNALKTDALQPGQQLQIP